MNVQIMDLFNKCSVSSANSLFLCLLACFVSVFKSTHIINAFVFCRREQQQRNGDNEYKQTHCYSFNMPTKRVGCFMLCVISFVYMLWMKMHTPHYIMLNEWKMQINKSENNCKNSTYKRKNNAKLTNILYRTINKRYREGEMKPAWEVNENVHTLR